MTGTPPWPGGVSSHLRRKRRNPSQLPPTSPWTSFLSSPSRSSRADSAECCGYIDLHVRQCGDPELVSALLGVAVGVAAGIRVREFLDASSAQIDNPGLRYTRS